MKTTTNKTVWNVSKLASPSYAPQFGIYADEEQNDLAIVKGENSEAHAKLISAAPELLEACKALLEEFKSRTALIESCDLTEAEDLAVELAEQAISKASQ